MIPAQIRQAITERAFALAAAAQTGNPHVVNAMTVDFELLLNRLIPDKPTLESVLSQQSHL